MGLLTVNKSTQTNKQISILKLTNVNDVGER